MGRLLTNTEIILAARFAINTNSNWNVFRDKPDIEVTPEIEAILKEQDNKTSHDISREILESIESYFKKPVSQTSGCFTIDDLNNLKRKYKIP